MRFFYFVFLLAACAGCATQDSAAGSTSDALADMASDGALAAAMNYEAFQVGRNKRQEKESTPDWGSLSAQIREILLEEKEASQNMTTDFNSEEYKKRRCYLCNELGHWKRDCPMFVRNASSWDDDAGNED